MTRRSLSIVATTAVFVAVALGALAPTTTPAAPNVVPPWQAAQASSAVIRGTFSQKKHLAELEQPLLSSGEFVVAADRGLIWQIRQPVQAELVITRQHLVQRSGGHEIARISAGQQPALRVVAAVLLAVFQADMDRLRQYFKIQKQSRDGDHWSMTLLPKAAGVAEVIERVQIRGAADIERIEIHQPGGDRSVIELDVAAGPAMLSTDEQAKFSR